MGRQHTILPNFPKNCMKLKEFGSRGRPSCPLRLVSVLTKKFKQESIPVGCLPPAFVVPGRGMGDGMMSLPVWSRGRGEGSGTTPCEQNDTQVEKHYLPATSFVGGKMESGLSLKRNRELRF